MSQYPKILTFFLKIHDFQLLELQNSLFLEKGASNYVQLLILIVLGVSTLGRVTKSDGLRDADL